MFPGGSKADTLLSFQQAGFGRAAQEYERAALDEAHVAIARATEVSKAVMFSDNEQINLGPLLKSFCWT